MDKDLKEKLERIEAQLEGLSIDLSLVYKKLQHFEVLYEDSKEAKFNKAWVKRYEKIEEERDARLENIENRAEKWEWAEKEKKESIARAEQFYKEDLERLGKRHKEAMKNREKYKDI